jgi:hypothetical protein
LDGDVSENLWEQLLSRQPELVQQAFSGLEPPDRQAVIAHLQRMFEEPGWHPEQRKSAEIALQSLTDIDQSEDS